MLHLAGGSTAPALYSQVPYTQWQVAIDTWIARVGVSLPHIETQHTGRGVGRADLSLCPMSSQNGIKAWQDWASPLPFGSMPGCCGRVVAQFVL
jgi:hypothetical protein